MVINNQTRSFIYFNKYSETTYNNLYEILNIDLVKNADLKAHESNISNFYLRPDNYREVINGIYPIPPRTIWKFENNLFTNLNLSTVSLSYNSDFPDFISILNRLSKVLINKRIGVELSGGLDTSIVIGILKHFGFNPFLVGVQSKKYEFRTESYIQNVFSNSTADSYLLDSSETLPFSNLLSCPIHSLPSASSLGYMHADKISDVCMENNINIVLSGMGFDTLLCENPLQDNNSSLPNSWRSWALDDNWLNEYIYNERSISYKSAAASQIIIRKIWSMRKKEGEDSKKWWGRNMFSDYLPNELVKYAYKTDNSGEFLEGLLKAKQEISRLFEVVQEVTGLYEFSQTSLNIIMNDIHLADDKKDKLLLARVSFANWIYGLVRDKILVH